MAGAVWIGWQEGAIRLERFLDPTAWLLDGALGLGTGALLLGLWEVARQALPAARRLEERLGELLGPINLSEVVALALLSGFAEELFFRGALQGAWGWLAATILFALAHPEPNRGYGVWTVFVGVAGLALAGLVVWRGNLLPAIVAHSLVNGVNLARLARRQASFKAGKLPVGEK
ncbi:MAG: CPBP family intramembrane glutamic endopeptidase [Thermoanaerobaculia bacterium]